jgi:hypothetical protein
MNIFITAARSYSEGAWSALKAELRTENSLESSRDKYLLSVPIFLALIWLLAATSACYNCKNRFQVVPFRADK